MQSIELNLETKIFYRLVKVLYIFSLSLFFLGVLYIGYDLKPYEIVDNENSYFICPDNTKKYSFKELDLYFYTQVSFSWDDNAKAKRACDKNFNFSELLFQLDKMEPRKRQKFQEIAKKEIRRREKETPNPELQVHYQIIGSWFELIKFFFISLSISFLVLNLIL
tara:strand:+ start:177 stop:671 length:495 start_codon:yes stop_codon:yes gene_type:complete